MKLLDPTMEDRIVSPFVTAFVSDRERVMDERIGANAYDHGRGDALYYNAHWGLPAGQTLPCGEDGTPQLPPHAVVAIVNFNCMFCHAFIAQNNYPTQMPDGRPIVYIDMANEESRAFIQQQGYKGAGKGVLSVVLNPDPTLHHRRVKLANKDTITRKSFPVLLMTDDNGNLSEGLASGVIGCTNRFLQLRGENLLSVGPPNPLADRFSENPDTQTAQSCIALVGHKFSKREGALVYELGHNHPQEEAEEMRLILRTLGVDGVPEEAHDGRRWLVIRRQHAPSIENLLTAERTNAPWYEGMASLGTMR